MKSEKTFFLKLIVGLLLLILLFKQLDLKAVVQVYSTGNYWVVVSAFGLLFLGEFTRIYRIQILLNLKEIYLSSLTQIKTYFMSTFFGSFMPSSLGSDVARFWFLKQEKTGANNLVLTSILLADRVIGLVGLALLFLMSLFLDWSSLQPLVVELLDEVKPIWLISISLLVGILFVVLRNYIKHWALFLWLELKPLFSHRQTIIISLLLSILYQLGIALTVYLIYLGLVTEPILPATIFFLFVPVINLITILPLSIAGIGIREWSFVFLFSPLGIPQTELVAISLTLFFFILAQSALGGLIFLFKYN